MYVKILGWRWQSNNELSKDFQIVYLKEEIFQRFVMKWTTVIKIPLEVNQDTRSAIMIQDFLQFVQTFIQELKTETTPRSIKHLLDITLIFDDGSLMFNTSLLGTPSKIKI